MGIRYYDEAIYNKIKSWVRDPNMRILKPLETKELFESRADLGNDKPITLPLISISRDSKIQLDYTQKRNLTFDGLKIGTGEKGIAQLNAVPFTVFYQIDIYTKEYILGDEYLRNFIFNFINYPKLSIVFPYNGIDVEQVAYLELSEDVDDGSDIPEKLFSDQFTRWTLMLKLKDAYFFNTPINPAYSIDDASLEVVNKDEEDIESVDTEDIKIE